MDEKVDVSSLIVPRPLLRDLFAAAALTGMLAAVSPSETPIVNASFIENGTNAKDAFPQMAYEYADQMLAARATPAQKAGV